jgi:soluble lytic murein transglycosylase
MISGLPEPKHLPLKTVRWHLLVIVAITAFALVSAGNAVAAKKKTKSHPAKSAIAKTTPALPVPTPHLSPKAPGATPAVAAAPASPSADTIGALISEDDASEQTSTEDSDAPQAAAPRPDFSQPRPPSAPVTGPPVNPVGLKLALQLLNDNNPAGALLAAYALPDRTDIKIVNWMVATGGYPSIPSNTLADLRKQLTDWPAQQLLKLRYEQALVREQPAPADVIRILGATKPASDDATIMLGNAFLAAGRKADAANLIRPFWRDGVFSVATEKKIVQLFGDLLTRDDNETRMDRQLYAEDAAAALRTAGLLDKNQQAVAKAVALLIKGSSKAGNAIDALLPTVGRDPLLIYSKVQLLRRAGKSEDAGHLLLTAPRDPKALIDPDAWWVERRLVSRQLIGEGDAQLAYTIAANHSAESPTMQAEAEFHAGWYALEYLHDPSRAQGHFAAIAGFSKMPLSLSRAEYWLGRDAQAAGDNAGAGAHYQRAAAFPTTFYGQLALARLGGRRLPIAQAPTPSGEATQRFSARELVRVIQHLTAAGYPDRAGIFYRTLADVLTDPGEVALLAGMAEDSGNHQLALQIGKTAASHGLQVDALAFPTTAIPPSAKTPGIERPVVFAIARQESAFNPQAVSGAGARGLLQLMPATAKSVAKSAGVAYSKDRLTSDPAYNAFLGSTHLGTLVDDFGGSYVMTIAAYNAGESRVQEWVRQNGDPRDPKVDVVNWIERIPFTETRNYVQRVMENLQVYRARLGQNALTIEADLHRGGPVVQ